MVYPQRSKACLVEQKHTEVTFKAWLFSTTIGLKESLAAGGASLWLCPCVGRLFYLTVPSLFLTVSSCTQCTKEVWDLELPFLISIPAASISSCQEPLLFLLWIENLCLSQGHSALKRPSLNTAHDAWATGGPNHQIWGMLP